MERYEAVIGIEIHCQLRTASKMFCGCSTAYDGAAPNTHVCPVCLALPGHAAGDQPTSGGARDRHRPGDRGERSRSAPSGSARTTSTRTCRRATRSASTRSRWRRGAGWRSRRPPGRSSCNITRAHLEEDTAKLVHGDAVRGGSGSGGGTSLVDFNRAGAPLMEIVTEPEIRTAEQARRYAEELQLAPARDRGVATRTWSAARCGSRRTSRSGRAGPSPSGRGSRSRT